MIQYLILGISLISLYLALVWISFLYLYPEKRPKVPKNLPSVTIAVPAFNEEKCIIKTIQSLVNLNYPKNKLKIIVVNDGSTDNTRKVVHDFIKPFKNVTLINKRNQGCKAAPVNSALKLADTELFGCVDADSTVHKDSLRYMVHHFNSPDTGAVITALKVIDPKNLWERLQRMEYIMAILSRKLRASINTLAMTPGVLSVYKTQILKDIGGFDQNNITEDFEIALRLKYHKYNIKIEPKAITFTKVPDSLRSLWRQRIRWYRGYIFNHLKYKDMFFNKKYGLLGYFQLPLNIIGIGLLFASIGLISYSIIDHFSEVFIRLFTLEGYLSNLLYLPTLKEFILSHNLKLMIPIYIASITGLYLFYSAHRQAKEKIRFPFALVTYFVVYPYFAALEWISAFSQEIFKTKKKW